MVSFAGSIREKIEGVHAKVVAVDNILQNVEKAQGVVDPHLKILEEKVHIQNLQITMLQLHSEENGNRSRRNNIWIKGIS